MSERFTDPYDDETDLMEEHGTCASLAEVDDYIRKQFGPPGVGKSALAMHLSRGQPAQVVNLSEREDLLLVYGEEWNEDAPGMRVLQRAIIPLSEQAAEDISGLPFREEVSE